MLLDKISTLPLTPPLVIQSGTSVSSVVEQIQAGAVGCVVICQGERLIGILTERDVLLKIVARDVDYSKPVDDFMTPDPVTLPPHATIGDAVSIMVEHNFRHLPITEAGDSDLIAVVSIKDVINLVAESFPAQVLNLPPRPHQKMEEREGA